MNKAKVAAGIVARNSRRRFTKTLVKQSLSGHLRSADLLKQVVLTNGDEPAFLFSADVE
ncbi:MAG TPA: hypothetical protein VJX67_19710 [Blastocatellia bacterium]|nr:hypothetical protein [Blastocatellia bacterium]